MTRWIVGLILPGLLGLFEAYAQDTSCGIVWYPAIQLSVGTQWSAVRPTIALSGDDTIHIVWMTDKDTVGINRLPYAVSTNAGMTFNTHDLLPDSSAFPRYAAYPYVLANHSDVYVLF